MCEKNILTTIEEYIPTEKFRQALPIGLSQSNMPDFQSEPSYELPPELITSLIDKVRQSRNKRPLGQPIHATPPKLTDAQISEAVESGIVGEARRNGKELVLNPLHPANRPGVQPGEDFWSRVNRGIKGTGEAHRESGGRQTRLLEPDDY